jgi:hypothetical protein
MRLLILTAAAALALAAPATAKETHHRHASDSNASVAHSVVPTADPAAPADSMSPHDAHMLNLEESGYNPRSDFDGHGVMKTN